MVNNEEAYGLSSAEVDECRAAAFMNLTAELDGEAEKSLDELDEKYHKDIIACRYWSERAAYLLDEQFEIRRKR